MEEIKKNKKPLLGFKRKRILRRNIELEKRINKFRQELEKEKSYKEIQYLFNTAFIKMHRGEANVG